MRAVTVSDGAPARLRVGEVREPETTPSQALVRVSAVSLNRGEVRRSQAAEPGFRPGWDLAGNVERAALDGTALVPDAAGGISGPGTAKETARSAGAEDTDAPTRGCLCGCGQAPRGRKSRFVQGHDHRLFGEIKRNLQKDPLLRNERFTDAQRAYARERGLI